MEQRRTVCKKMKCWRGFCAKGERGKAGGEKELGRIYEVI
jgi:hypothetical protein